MKRLSLKRKVLSENDRLAGLLRDDFRANGILCLNLVSSPGAGKTTLLERTLETLPADTRVAVLTGDIKTDNDARRLARFGFLVRQINTDGACHLDARMIQRALGDWRLGDLDLLLIENVGNLVCPSSYDLGEGAKIAMLSVTEGEDKPLKYPSIFVRSELLILSKIDLLPHVPVEIARLREHALRVNPCLELLEVSSLSGAGLDAWRQWLARRLADLRANALAATSTRGTARLRRSSPPCFLDGVGPGYPDRVGPRCHGDEGSGAWTA